MERCSVLKITKCCGSQKSLLWSGLTYWRKRDHRLKCLRVRPMWQEIAIPVPPKWILHVFQGDCHMTWTGICLASASTFTMSLNFRLWAFKTSLAKSKAQAPQLQLIIQLSWKWEPKPMAHSGTHVENSVIKYASPCFAGWNHHLMSRLQWQRKNIWLMWHYGENHAGRRPSFLGSGNGPNLAKPQEKRFQTTNVLLKPRLPCLSKGWDEPHFKSAEGIQISFWRAVTQGNAPIWRTWMQLRPYSGFWTQITINSCE